MYPKQAPSEDLVHQKIARPGHFFHLHRDPDQYSCSRVMMLSFILPFLASVHLVSGVCECGYSIKNPEGEGLMVFADRLETNFSQLDNISQWDDWQPQLFKVSAESGRGDYSQAFVPANVITGGTESQHSDPEGNLELLVGNAVNKDGAITASEIDTSRRDFHWGSFRAGMKLTSTKGTCAAFFWYHNDTQEIDIEFLSREFSHNRGIYPINLVVQSKKSMEAGYDASKTGTYKRVNLDFDPTDTFHEYRFDYIPGQVLFYADSKLLAQMKGDDMPSAGGHLILRHWSNGNPSWSGGPPKEDATVAINYVRAYFNSTNHERQSYLGKQCRQSSKTSVCAIDETNDAASIERLSWALYLGLTMLCVEMGFGMLPV
ncbi:hypothetical protein FSARC_5578 [Fusarium sarcochroum]|uniref:GH16 domain-containing protein n=1 Tax=Fusarium sarcochroum TaxID=1208366 RepID=A0A8H4TZ72_9HYPO|nr:hypothetical protein FSARC_5578 [Fusarium sarcochroum]